MTRYSTVGLIKRFITYIGILEILSFWIIYTVISYFNRLATDDYSMIGISNHSGIWGGAVEFYYRWSGEFFAALIQLFTLHLVQNLQSLVLYNIFLLSFLSYSLFFFCRQLYKILEINIDFLNTIFISQFFLQALFFSSFAIDQNWFWVVGSTAYIYPICLMLLSSGLLMRFKQTSDKFSLLLSLAFGVILGSYPINYTVLYVFVVGSFCAYELYLKRHFTISTVLFLFFIMIGIIINLLSPGNFKRLAVQKEAMGNLAVKIPDISDYLWLFPFELINKLITTKAPYVLLFAIPMVYFLKLAEGKNKYLPTTKKFGLIIFLTLSFFVAVYTTSLIFYAVAHWGISYRSILHINFVFIVLTTCVLYGMNLKLKELYVLPIVSACLVLGVYLNVKTLSNQFPVVSKYANAYDKRTQEILNAKKNFKDEILCLEPLPSSGILLTAEISKDSSNYVNGDMKKCLELPFVLSLKR